MIMSPNENTPLLGERSKQDKGSKYSPLSARQSPTTAKHQPYGACDAMENGSPRPGLNRAASSTAMAAHENPTPLLSRPLMSASTPNMTALLRPIAHRAKTSQSPNQRPPSLLRRATDMASSALDLTSLTYDTRHHGPPSPTYWTDHVHKVSLLEIWDAVMKRNDALQASRRPPASARVVETRRQMVHKFPELGNGEVALERDWIEFILGVNMRRPWCTLEYMSRWEVLATSGGARANWGPW